MGMHPKHSLCLDFRSLCYWDMQCVIAMNIDPKVKNISEKVYVVILWIIPLLNITVRRSRQSGVARATCPD